jgi:hypothetical protein
MSVTALDTHQAVKALKLVGFSEEQAEAVTKVVRDSQNIDFSSLATKADLAELRLETKADLAELRLETKAEFAKVRTEISETKSEIIKWVVGMGFAQAGLMMALLRFMH